jgi:hypothetical protein
MKKLLLIQGVFFQATRNFSVGYDSNEGAVAVIAKVLKQSVYHAIVRHGDSPSETTFSGQMHDHVGYSTITDLEMTETKLSFIKQYPSRQAISYVFNKKEGNVWTGIYEGPDCGRGFTNCIVTEVSEAFFEIEESVAMELLEQI